MPKPSGCRRGLRHQPHEVLVALPAAPRVNGPQPGCGSCRVGHDEPGVDLHPGAQAGAVRATPPTGSFERERPRLQLIERQVVIQAGQMLGIHPLPVRVIISHVHEIQQHHATGQAQRRLHRVGQPAAAPRPSPPAGPPPPRWCAASCLARTGDSVEPDDGPVDPRPGVSLHLQFAEQFGVFTLPLPDHRRQHLEPGPPGQLQHPVHNLAAAPAARSAARTPGNAAAPPAHKQQLQHSHTPP